MGVGRADITGMSNTTEITRRSDWHTTWFKSDTGARFWLQPLSAGHVLAAIVRANGYCVSPVDVELADDASVARFARLSASMGDGYPLSIAAVRAAAADAGLS